MTMSATFHLEAYHSALEWARTRYSHKRTASSIDILRSMIMTPHNRVFSITADRDDQFPLLPIPTQEMLWGFVQKTAAKAQQVSPPKSNTPKTVPLKNQVTVQAQVEIQTLILKPPTPPKKCRESRRRTNSMYLTFDLQCEFRSLKPDG